MNKKIIFIVLAILAMVLLFFVAKFLLERDSGPAVLKISSNPPTTIFLDGTHLGKTPYEDKVKPGEYTLKLVPDSGSKAISWETKLKLNNGMLTFVNRDLSDNELTSAGEILTLEKISGQSAQIVVISTPDGALTSLDSTNKGETPLSLSSIDPGDHDLTLTKTGFADRSLKIRTTAGFKVTASFQLALTSAEATVSATPSATPSASGNPKPTVIPKSSSATSSAQLARPYVQILDTPTGFLRVRVESSTNATEAAQVKPGETYPLLGEKSGWYQIKYQGTSSGWISGQYAEKFE